MTNTTKMTKMTRTNPKVGQTEAEAEIEQAEMERACAVVFEWTMHDIVHLVSDDLNARDQRLCRKLRQSLDSAIQEFEESEPKFETKHVRATLFQMLNSELCEYVRDQVGPIQHEPGCIHYKPLPDPEVGK